MKAVAKVLVYNREGYILVLRSSMTHPLFAFQPDLPGGEINKNEDIRVGAAREVFEETGLSIQPEELRMVHEQTHRSRRWVLFEAHLTEVRPRVKLSWEHDRFEWVLPTELVDRPLSRRAGLFYSMAVEVLRQSLD